MWPPVRRQEAEKLGLLRRRIPGSKIGGKAPGSVVRAAWSFESRAATCACGNPHRRQPARMLCGNEHHVSRRHEGGSCTPVVRRADSCSRHGSRHLSFFGHGYLLCRDRTLRTLATEVTPHCTLWTRHDLHWRAGEETGLKETLLSGDPRAFIDEITDFFQKNQLLSRAEFYQVAKRVRRS